MKKHNVKDIAVIGMSCNFPKSENTTEFWNNLRNGEDLVHTYSDEELMQFGVEEALIKNPNFKRVDSKIKNADHFDFPFFGYTKEEAKIMDPQSRLMHQGVWAALEDASINIKDLKQDIGLYLAAANSYNWINYVRLNPSPDVDAFFTLRLANSQFISTLVSYKLNLTGPSLNIDTACSSSLVAIHVACRNLLLRECTTAIAGGVALNMIDNKGYFYQEGMIYSKDGRCRPFDKSSSGTIGGEGLGLVVLKRLEDAIRDKDYIYTVIKASSANNDGNSKIGYTAPSIVGQSKCISNAYKFAKVEPETIRFIEAHGTGTQLGDPVEVSSLNKVFKNNTTHKCALGSVKSNMGHLDTAAGVAGFIKASLVLKHEEIPPTLHFQESNPNVAFDSGPFYVNSKLEKLERINGAPLRTAVSSLGIGGTNAHVLLEEAPKRAQDKKERKYELVTFSAKTSDSLQKYKSKFSNYLESLKNDDLVNVAYTSKMGRSNFNVRDFVVCHSIKEGIQNLQEGIQNNSQNILSGKKEIVFMFPGQGSQFIGMGKTLYEEERAFASVMDKGFEWLQKTTKEDYKTILGYGDTPEKEASKINKTLYTQPILFLLEVALAKLFLSWGIKPAHMIGHSLGEYAAACISGVFSLEDGLKLIVKRAQLMQALPEGDMLAVGTTAMEIKALLPKELSIATINTKDACTISGNPSAIENFVALLDKKDIPYKKLFTSHAFHSEMMDDMLSDFKKELKTLNLSEPSIPFISNFTGKEILPEEATSPEYWVNHLRYTVKFSEGIKTLLQKKQSVYLEIGPGKSLSIFCNQHIGFKKNNNVSVQVLSHPKKAVADNYILTKALGELWSHGIEIDWKAYYNNEVKHKIPLPSYCFENYSFPARINLKKLYGQLGVVQNAVSNSYNEWLYVKNWKKSIQQKGSITRDSKQDYLIFSNQSPFIEAIKEFLIKTDNNVIEVIEGEKFQEIGEQKFTLKADSLNQFKELFDVLSQKKVEAGHILFSWNLSDSQDDYEGMFTSKLNLCQSLINYRKENTRKLSLINNFQKNVLGNEKMDVNAIASNIIFKICAQENPLIETMSIDVDQTLDNVSLIEKVISDIQDDWKQSQIVYRNNQKWIPFYEKISPKPVEHSILSNKTYLITGGLGTVGTTLVAHLCDTYQAKVIITGRSILPPKQQWVQVCKAKSEQQSILDKISYLIAHKKEGRDVHYVSTDISNETQFSKAITEIELTHGPISGVIHAAGISDSNTYKFVEEIDQQIVAAHFSAKVSGTQNLYKIFKDKPLDFVWITSSLSSVLGGLTYGAYAAANSYIDAFLTAKSNDLDWSWVNLDGVSDKGINKENLVNVFETSINSKETPQLIVSVRDINLRSQNKNTKEKKVEEGQEELIIQRPEIQTNYVKPVTDIEIELCRTWETFFGYDKVGLKDDFFDLGGDSLKAMTVIKRINKKFNISFNLKDFFSKPTIEELAPEIELILQVQNLQVKKKGLTKIRI